MKSKKVSGLQSKLIKQVLLTVIVVVPLIFGAVTYYYVSNFRKQEIENGEEQLERVASQIHFLQTLIGNVAKQVILDDTVQVGMNTKNDSSGTYLYNKRHANEALASYAHVVDTIQEIMIYSVEKDTFTSMATARTPFKPEQNEWYTDFKARDISRGYTGMHKSAAMQDNYMEDVFSYVMTFYDTNGKTERGDLIVNIRASYLEEILNINMPLMIGCVLYDGEGDPLYSAGTVAPSYSQVIEHRNEKQFICDSGDICLVSNEMEDDWVLMVELSKKGLFKQMVPTVLGITLAFLGVGVLLVVVMSAFIRRIVQPVQTLTESVVALGSGNFETKVDIRTNDELEILADVYNKMVEDIQHLMKESLEHEKLKRRMQIDKLMNQINPHFIYNTLNSIVYMAKIDGDDKIVNFTNAFISLLQNTLRVQDSVYVTLGEELQNIENYLIIQKYRYTDKFEAQICCDKSLEDALVPSVMLEPIVENAIFHGLSPKEESGTLKIQIEKDDKNLLLTVIDDGIGMSREMVQKLLSDEQPDRGGIHKIGVANVRNRIKEIYGEEYDLVITSEEGKGTTISVVIPYQTEEKKTSNA